MKSQLIRAVVACGMVTVAGGTARADDVGRLSAIEENDYFTPDNRDRHYTQGLQLDYLSEDLGRGFLGQPMSWIDDAAPFFFQGGDNTSRRIDLFAGQELFTPQNKRAASPPLDDRPYAGWLHGGISFLEDDDSRQLDSFTIDGGLVGPGAKGEQTQNRFHLNIGDTASLGWGYQLRNEPTVNFFAARHWRFIADLDDTLSADFIPEATLAAGNAYDYGGIGGRLRFGRNLRVDYGPNRLGPGPTGTAYVNNDKLVQGTSFGWYVFVGTEGRAVGHNIFLNGNTDQPSRSVSIRPLVGDLEAGAVAFYSDWLRLSYTYLYRSDEFYGQHNGDNFGSIVLSTVVPF